MAKDQDWYAERVNRFIGLSACQYIRTDSTYEEEVLYFSKLNEVGVYNFFGGDESSLNAENCAAARSSDCGNLGFDAQAVAINAFMYFSQIAIEGRFQEP